MHVLDSLMNRATLCRMSRSIFPETGTQAVTGKVASAAHAPVTAFVLAGLVAAFLSAAMAATLMPEAGMAAPGVALTVVAAVVLLALMGIRRAHPHARVGAANIITLIRAAIMALVAAALCLPGGLADRPTLAWVLVGIVTVGLVLDGIDGWLARRTGLASGFGARFDMEVDAMLAAALCLVAIHADKAGLWLIPLGFLRYAWVIAGLWLPWLTRDLPDRVGRKTACVLQISVLTSLLSPAVAPPVSIWIAAVAMSALFVSFAADALWLWRRR